MKCDSTKEKKCGGGHTQSVSLKKKDAFFQTQGESRMAVDLEIQPFPFCVAMTRRGTPNERIVYLMNYLSMGLRFKHRMGEMGVVVFDIDDTLVDESEHKMLPVVRLYRLCQSLKFKVAIVTARPDTPMNRRETIRMLPW